jgi:hypothetical protein
MKQNTFPVYASFSNKTKSFSTTCFAGKNSAVQIPKKGTYTEQAVLCFVGAFLTKYALDPHYVLNTKIQRKLSRMLFLSIDSNITGIKTKIEEIKNIIDLQNVMFELTNTILDPVFHSEFKSEFKDFGTTSGDECFTRFLTALQCRQHYISAYIGLLDVKEIMDNRNFHNLERRNIINSDGCLPVYQSFIQTFEDIALPYTKKLLLQNEILTNQVTNLINEITNIKNHLSLN